MSASQPRSERSDGKPRRAGGGGRSGSSAHQHHRGCPGGGVGGKVGAAAPPQPFPAPQPLSTNRSFKKLSNGEVMQWRVNSVISEAGGHVAAVQNGMHTQAQRALIGSSDAPVPSVANIADTTMPKSSSSGAVPKAPSSSQTAVAAASDAATPTTPMTPAKGDVPNQFTLQFGTISPGIMNRMQIPARTSSAPPNLDEQKHDQARHDSFRAAPTLPIPRAPKPQSQQTWKDVTAVGQSNTVVPHPPTQTRGVMHSQIPTASAVRVPKTSIPPVAEMSMPMPFQQPQVTLKFGGPIRQMQSLGVTASSLQMPVVLPVGNPPQVPQQMFLPLQSHPLQMQAMMHQGQAVGFGVQMGHQIAPQLGDMGSAIASQFPQQQPGKLGGQRKTSTVKITHPETHEELRLNKRTDPYSHASAPGPRPTLMSQSQPGPAFTPSHQINYYPTLQHNSYNPSPIFYHNPNSIPSTQITSVPQAPRYSFPVNPMAGCKTAPPLHGVSEAIKLATLSVSTPSAPIQETIRPSAASTMEAVGTTAVTVSMPTSKAEAAKPWKQLGDASHVDKIAVSSVMISVPVVKDEKPKSIKSTGEASLLDRIGSVTIVKPVNADESPKSTKPPGHASAHEWRDSEIALESSIQQKKSVPDQSGNSSLPPTERHSSGALTVLSTQTAQSETSSAPVTPVGDSGSGLSGTDGRKEPIRRSDSLKDHQKKSSKKDMGHSQQQCQPDASDSVGDTKLPSSRTIKGSTVAAWEDSNSSENDQAHPSAPTMHSSSQSVEHRNFPEGRPQKVAEDEAKTSVLNLSGGVLEKRALQDAFGNLPDKFESQKTEILTSENGPFQASAILAPQVAQTIFDDIDSPSDDRILVKGEHNQGELEVTEHDKCEVSIDSSQDSGNAKVYPVSGEAESSEMKSDVSVYQEGTGPEISDKVTISEIFYAERPQLGTSKEEEGCILEVDSKAEERGTDATTSSEFIDAESDRSSHPQSINTVEDKPSPCNAITEGSETMCSGDVVLTDLGASHSKTASDPVPSSCGLAQKLEGKIPELSTRGPFSGPREKPCWESTGVKMTAGKRKKKSREILSKADAAGTSDLYNAYKAPGGKHEVSTTAVSTDGSLLIDTESMPVDVSNKTAIASEEDAQRKTEVDDWEDAAEISSPQLRTPDNGQGIYGVKKHDENENEALSRKKYSRDFLLTFSGQCRELPLGFEIGSDIADALMSGPVGTMYVVNRGPYPSPGRVADRSPGSQRMDRRTVGIVDEDKWNKASASFGTGHDLRIDVGRASAAVSFRPGQGVDHGVLRNPRGQSSSGGILSGPLQSLPSQGGFSRQGVDADRWQRGASIPRGLMPSPQTPAQLMHKAAKRYEVGKVSDQEEAKQRQLKAILNKLTPQNFEKLFLQVKEVNIDNAATLTSVISQIFDKALMEPTFCEMYANFCVHLASALPDFNEDNEKITFKRLLLNKCQEEFERGEIEQEEASKTGEDGEIKQSEEEREEKRLKARRRMLGNIRLIGELYKKKMLTERIMHNCITKLLGQYQNPDEEDIEALCKLMSTIGEMIDHSKAKKHMDEYFNMMTKLSTNQKLSSRMRFMLKDTIDLRKNKWLQRRKIEGPKKIEEVHRDAAQERQAQAGRMGRGPVMNSSARRVPTMDYGPRGSTVLPSPGLHQISRARGLPTQVRDCGSQDARMEDRHLLESRTLSVPLPQRNIDDDSITLGPQGGLARGMSIGGQPLMSNAPLTDSCRVPSGPNGVTSAPDHGPYRSKEEITPTYMSNRSAGALYDQPRPEDCSMHSGIMEPRIVDLAVERSSSATLSAGRVPGSTGGNQTAASESRSLSEEFLREKSILAIREFYSAKDEDEVALCIRELNSPSFYPAMVSLWVMDSFERKDVERDLLTRLLIILSKSHNSLLSHGQLIQGFESVLSSLEDAMNDAPRAAEFLGQMLSRIILENVVPFREISRLIHAGGEEPGRLMEIGLAADVLGSILEFIQAEKGDSVLNEIRNYSNPRLEDFRPPHPLKSKKLDAFL